MLAHKQYVSELVGTDQYSQVQELSALNLDYVVMVPLIYKYIDESCLNKRERK